MSNGIILIDAPTGEEFFRGEASSIILGREEGVTIVIPDSTISRAHAEFLKIGNDWCMRDLGSTNGTTLNGTLLNPHHLVVVRAGDRVSFGEYSVGIREEGPLKTVPSIHILKEDSYQGEFPIGPNTDFSFGGPKATIPASELGTEELVFIVRQQDGELILSCKHPEILPFLNGEVPSGRVKLSDKDEIQVGSLQMLVSSRTAKTAQEIKAGQLLLDENGGEKTKVSSGIESEDLPSTEEFMNMPSYLQGRFGEDGWEDPWEKKRRQTTSILTIEEPQDAEIPAQKYGGMTHAELVGGQRFSMPSLETVKQEKSRKEKIQAVIGSFTLLAIYSMMMILLNLHW